MSRKITFSASGLIFVLKLNSSKLRSSFPMIKRTLIPPSQTILKRINNNNQNFDVFVSIAQIIHLNKENQ